MEADSQIAYGFAYIAGRYGAQRFNPNHGAAGSGKGGQFVSAGSGGGSKGAKPVTAHQKHVAHEEHLAHLKYLASHPDTPGARAERKKSLLEQARSDRAKAAQLEKRLHSLQVQEKKSSQAAKAALAAAGRKHASPKQLAAAKHRHRVTQHRHATVKQQITGLQKQIGGLLTQARDLEAQAAKL